MSYKDLLLFEDLSVFCVLRLNGDEGATDRLRNTYSIYFWIFFSSKIDITDYLLLNEELLVLDNLDAPM